MAVAHSQLELVWHLLSTGEVYQDLGEDNFTSRQDVLTHHDTLSEG